MVAMNLFVSLGMVKQEVVVTLISARQALQAFVESEQADRSLEAFAQYLHQLKGVCTMIELEEGKVLLEALIALSQTVETQLGEWTDEADEAETEKLDYHLFLLGSGMHMLRRYLELLIAQKIRCSTLLIAKINEVHLALKKAPLQDHHFETWLQGIDFSELTYETAKSRYPELKKHLPRMRQLFQRGLVGLYKNHQSKTHIFLIDKSVERMQRLTLGTKMGVVWSLANTLVKSLMTGKLAITENKVELFSMLDRQFRYIMKEGLKVLDLEPPLELVNAYCFNLVIGGLFEALPEDVATLLQQREPVFTLAQLRSGLAFLKGPEDEILSAVYAALSQEIAKVEDQVDMCFRGATLEEGFFPSLSVDLMRISRVYFMLNQQSVYESLQALAASVATWQGTEPNSQDNYAQLAEVLLMTGQVMHQGYGERLLDQDSPFGRLDTVIDQSNKIVVSESRMGLATARRALMAYIEHDHDLSYLEDAVVVLNQVWGAAIFIDEIKAAEVMKLCARYFQEMVDHPDAPAPSSEQLDALADTLSCMDYLLESIEEKKPFGEGLALFAEERASVLTAPLSMTA